ncbi:aldehyde dehydrogenase family protein [Mycobacterium sp. URHB0044]|jgi:1-pyrroline dehydrogenase|uniref:aldehyde dehydrogenase family protein n=1 Tax=Mycobacterium sp. URHB0044 TaxID=1380386 RepID=UPI0004921094|nr:aldehyde dehydrogenase family protein [Mycobacterium sp. URHB0044]
MTDTAVAPTQADATFEVVNPADGTSLAVLPMDTDIDAAVAAAAAALPAWSALTPGERSSYLLQIADRLEEYGDELAELESRNVGKPLSHAREEISPSADAMRWAAGAARSAHGLNAGEYAPGILSYALREPIGVVGLITPWNFPLLEAIFKLAPALAAGNTVVLKPSELTPLTTIRFAELVADILPTGVLTVVLGDGRVGATLVSHPGVGLVSLTGDVSTGMKVAANAASGLKRVHLELGGKAPVLVFDDADLEATVAALVACGFGNAGQDCCAACRVIVSDAVYDDFVDAYVRRIANVVVGDPSDDATVMGPVVSAKQLERVIGFVDRARADGATVRCGGARVDRDGYFYAPTVITDVDQSSEIIQKEVFGPVVTIQRAADDDQMLQMANDVVYGLAASIWTKDLDRTQRMTAALAFGTVWVNHHQNTVPEMPFGGYGHSGYGKTLSSISLDDFSNVKHVMVKPKA